MIIMGLTGGFHFGSCDAAATILRDGVVLSSVEEERVSRVKIRLVFLQLAASMYLWQWQV